MKLPKISEVLHDAADHYLAASWSDLREGKDEYSCLAVSEALHLVGDRFCKEYGGNRFRKEREYVRWLAESIFDGMHNMGLTYRMQGECNIYEFHKKRALSLVERQGARYLWLKWCALMAEEQGE